MRDSVRHEDFDTMTSTLLTHALVLTSESSRPRIDDGAVLVRGGVVEAVGTTAELRGMSAERTVDIDGHILLPGFVNTHTHLAGTITRGLVEDVTTGAYLERIWPIEAMGISNGWFAAGERLGIVEHLMAGITTANDMFFDPASALNNAVDLGFRLLAGTVHLDFPGPDNLSPSQRMDEAASLLARFGDHPLVRVTAAPHGGYTVGPEQLESVWNHAHDNGLLFHIHAAESSEEDAAIRDAYGRRPVEHLGAVGVLDARTILAHAVRLDDSDIELLAQTGTAVAHCPISNLKTASGVCRVGDMLDKSVRVGLGTDGGTASNDYDMFAVMRTAAILAKNATRSPERFTAEEMLRMATLGGAEALGVGHLIGSIEEGKQADLVVVDTSASHNVPMFDPFTTLVYQAGRTDVTLTMVQGEILMERRRLTRVDLDSVVNDAISAGREITVELSNGAEARVSPSQ